MAPQESAFDARLEIGSSQEGMVLQADMQQAAAAEQPAAADAGPGNNGRREESDVRQPEGTTWMADQVMKPPPDEG
jgi:hypothetical protein